MLRIWGIEASQAIQYFRSTHPLCPGPGGTRVACGDNTVPLVAQKPTVLRLYVSGATPGASVLGIATRPSTTPFNPSFRVVGTGVMTAAAAAVRTNALTTIQVVLPPHVPGTFQFDVLAIEYAPNGGVVAIATSSITLVFVERRRVRIRLVRIHYTGRGMDVAAPTVKDFWDATDFAQRALPLPSPGFELVRDSVEEYDGNFTRIDPSAHDSAWPGFDDNNGTTGNLLNILDRLASAESLAGDVIYVGIYPEGVRQSAFAGWAVGRWIISDRVGETLAHEILHKIGQPQHGPCGGPANVDPAYPDYPAISALPAGSIGEVGMDVSLLVAYDPQTTFDLMTYCSPKWISPYNYVRCFQRLAPLPPDPPPPATLERPDDHVVALAFARVRDHWIVVDLPGFSRPRPPLPPPPVPPPHGEFEVVVVDREDVVRARRRATLTIGETSTEGIPDLIETEVPWIEQATAIELRRGKAVLARMPTAAAPALDVRFPPRAQLERGRGEIRYKADATSERMAVAVRVSFDGGSSWTALVCRTREGTIDVAPILEAGPAADACVLEVLATSGYHTAAQRSEPFRVFGRPRPILAWSSADARDGRVQANEPLRLYAIPAERSTPASEVTWWSDLQGELGQGTTLNAVLRKGRHRIEVRTRTAFEQPAVLDVEVE